MQITTKNQRRSKVIGKVQIAIIILATLFFVCGIVAVYFFVSQAPVQDGPEELARLYTGRYLAYYAFTLLAIIAGATYLLFIINIRQQKLDAAQEQLRILSMAVEQSPSTVMIVDTEGKIEYTNPKFTQLTGYTFDEVRGKNPSILKSGETSGSDYEELWEDIKKGNTWRGTFHNRKKNGEYYWEAASISAIQSSSGEITHYLALKEDITERVRLEDKFRLFVEAAPNGIIITNQKGQIELINSEAEGYFGYRRQELIGKPIENLIPERFWDKHIENRQAFFNNASIRKLGHNLNLLGKRKDGSEFPLEIGLSPIETKDEKFILASMTDISERLQLEKELAVRDQEIATSQALAVVGRMANMVAHDLRNPLSSIKMTLQIFNQKPPKDWNADELELNRIALEQVQYMEGIMTDLLSYSRPEELNLEWLNVDKLINQTVLLSQKQLDDHRVKINTWFQTGLPTINGDKDKLRQVFFQSYYQCYLGH